MAGIMANSVSKTMGSGDTAADKSMTGYLVNEQITLSVTPSGSAYSWGQARAVGSSAVRAALNDTDAATATFTPDVAGYYVITCLVDSTTAYVLRLAVADVATTTMSQVARLQPVADASVTAPAVGLCLYCSSTQSNVLAVKNSAGTVYTVTVTAV